MSHEVETMAFQGALPWHGLGVKVSNDLTPAQMRKEAGVDWEVAEAESFIEYNGKKINTGMKSLVRDSDSRILTNVGKNWYPCKNEDAFNFFNEYIMAGDMEMHTAGSLNDGGIVWALAKVKESFDVIGEDRVDSYMLFSNPHTYGKSIDVRFTPIRVVCANTLALSLQSAKSKNSVKMSHRMAFDPDVVKQQMGIAHDKFAMYKQNAQFLAKKRVTASDLIEFYNSVFPSTSRKDDVKVVKTVDDLSKNAKLANENLLTQPGAEIAEGSWWQAFNSVSYVTDHLYGQNKNNRLNSQWFGQNQARKVVAINKALELANKSKELETA